VLAGSCVSGSVSASSISPRCSKIPRCPSPSCTTRRARGRCSDPHSVCRLGEAVVAAVPQQNRAAHRAQVDVPFPDPGDVVPAPAAGAARSPSRTVSANADVYRWSSSSSRSREHSTSSNADSTPELPGSRDSSASGSNPAACLVSGTDPHPGNERIVTCAGQRVRARPRPAGGAARRAEPPLDQRRVHWISPAPSVSYGSSRDG
jgi:hypothetical protein